MGGDVDEHSTLERLGLFVGIVLQFILAWRLEDKRDK
jgi:hypothetical protein